MDDLHKRVALLERHNNSKIPGALKYIVSPLLVLVIGFYFNSQLQESERNFSLLQLEVVRIQAAQDMLQELFSGTPKRALIAEKLMAHLVDEKLGAEIRQIVVDYYSDEISDSVSGDLLQRQLDLAIVARKIRSPAAESILKAIDQVHYHVVIASKHTLTMAKARADSLRAKGYPAEVYRTQNGIYAVTLGSFPFSLAAIERREAIRIGVGRDDSWLSAGKLWSEKVYPVEP